MSEREIKDKQTSVCLNLCCVSLYGATGLALYYIFKEESNSKPTWPLVSASNSSAVGQLQRLSLSVYGTPYF